jgi:5-methylcytosine-specific restriction endonuclease McrA
MKNTDNLNATHFQIYDYWKNKYIRRDGTILDSWEDDNCIPVVEYDDAPLCWGCGEAIIGEYEKKGFDNPDLKLLWNDRKVKSKLNRCHIIPRALGGGVEPSNLFLMCPDCHFLSPDTTNASGFFRWVYKNRKEHVCGMPRPDIIIGKIEEELQARGLQDLISVLQTIPKEKYKEFMADGYKGWFEKNVGLHSTTLVESSIIVGMADYILAEVKRLQE